MQDETDKMTPLRTGPNQVPMNVCRSEDNARLSERTMGSPSGSGGNGFSNGALLATLVSSVLSGLPLAATANASRVPGKGTFAALPC